MTLCTCDASARSGVHRQDCLLARLAIVGVSTALAVLLGGSAMLLLMLLGDAR